MGPCGVWPLLQLSQAGKGRQGRNVSTPALSSVIDGHPWYRTSAAEYRRHFGYRKVAIQCSIHILYLWHAPSGRHGDRQEGRNKSYGLSTPRTCQHGARCGKQARARSARSQAGPPLSLKSAPAQSSSQHLSPIALPQPSASPLHTVCCCLRPPPALHLRAR